MSSVSCVNNFFIKADMTCHYIPGVSMVSSLIDLFLKCVCRCLPESTLKTNDYWSHIYHKPIKACLLFAFVPLLPNIMMWIMSCSDRTVNLDSFSKVDHLSTRTGQELLA